MLPTQSNPPERRVFYQEGRKTGRRETKGQEVARAKPQGFQAGRSVLFLANLQAFLKKIILFVFAHSLGRDTAFPCPSVVC